MTELHTNCFYHGDCLFVMKHDIPAESVDLIYLDPPFFGTGVQKGEVEWNPGMIQISYDDSKKFWSNQEIRDNAPLWMKGIAKKKPDSHWNPLARYLYYTMERLELCKNVLKPTGSIYLHCDWRASHYLKMVMDEVFGYKNFKNEIVWHYYNKLQGNINYFPKNFDILLFYTKSNKWVFNTIKVKRDNPVKYSKRIWIKDKTKVKGGYLGSAKENGKNVYYESNEKRVDAVWDIPMLSPNSKEKTGYPTQKPEALLERIIKASSNKGDVVLDPFCGCGTTIIAAHKMGRRWIGIDTKEVAFDVIKRRVNKMGLNQLNFDFKIKYPEFRISSETLMKMNGIEFENWVNKTCNTKKPSDDIGVDGIMEDGTAIQTKTYKVKYDIVGRLLGDAEAHSEVPKPVKKIRVVSRAGFEESAWERAEWISRNKKVEVELLTPKDMLKLGGAK